MAFRSATLSRTSCFTSPLTKSNAASFAAPACGRAAAEPTAVSTARTMIHPFRRNIFFTSRISVLLCCITPDTVAILEHAAQLEEPFSVAGVADAAADEEGAERGFGQEAGGNIVGELGAGGYAVHLSDFVSADGVDFFSEKWRQGEQVVHVSGAE